MRIVDLKGKSCMSFSNSKCKVEDRLCCSMLTVEKETTAVKWEELEKFGEHPASL